MNALKFLDNLLNHRFVDDNLTKNHGYVDFLVQGKFPVTHQGNDLRAALPSEFQSYDISNTPCIPLANGESVCYCRASLEITIQLLNNEVFQKMFLADSWTTLFEMDFEYWGDVFDVETKRCTSSGEKNYWRGKFRSLIQEDEIVRAYVPCIFAGDTPPDLELKSWQLRNWIAGSSSIIQLDIVRAAVNDELIKYLQRNPHKMYELKSRQFEELICEILHNFGWEVELTQATRDGGYDIFGMSKDISGVKSSWLIECKKYAPERKVGIEYVRSLCGVKNDLKAANMMIATTSFFTSGVKKEKNSRYDLELRDYDGIVEWLNLSYR